MSEKNLLVEYSTFKCERIVENAASDAFIVRGLVQRKGKRNQNGRIYPDGVLEREVEKYRNTFINEKRALGELDHPESSIVNLKNASHLITDLQWNEDDLYATMKILPTPSGNILKSLLESGVRIGISSRGLGSLKKVSENSSVVGEDFELVSFDFVSNPSTQGAFILCEGKKTRIVNNDDVPVMTLKDRLQFAAGIKKQNPLTENIDRPVDNDLQYRMKRSAGIDTILNTKQKVNERFIKDYTQDMAEEEGELRELEQKLNELFPNMRTELMNSSILLYFKDFTATINHLVIGSGLFDFVGEYNGNKFSDKEVSIDQIINLIDFPYKEQFENVTDNDVDEIIDGLQDEEVLVNESSDEVIDLNELLDEDLMKSAKNKLIQQYKMKLGTPLNEDQETSTSIPNSNPLLPEVLDDSKFNTFEKQLKMGIEVEREHTNDPLSAERIANDHLREDPHYYTKLKKAKLEEDCDINSIDIDDIDSELLQMALAQELENEDDIEIAFQNVIDNLLSDENYYNELNEQDDVYHVNAAGHEGEFNTDIRGNGLRKSRKIYVDDTADLPAAMKAMLKPREKTSGTGTENNEDEGGSLTKEATYDTSPKNKNTKINLSGNALGLKKRINSKTPRTSTEISPNRKDIIPVTSTETSESVNEIAPINQHYNVQCAWCKNGIRHDPEITGVSHGICPSCKDTFLSQARASKPVTKTATANAPEKEPAMAEEISKKESRRDQEGRKEWSRLDRGEDPLGDMENNLHSRTRQKNKSHRGLHLNEEFVRGSKERMKKLIGYNK
jgi:hypothetical protein